MFQIAVYAQTQEQFEQSKKNLIEAGVVDQQIHFVKSDSQTRVSYINQNLKKWIVFLDHDCRLTSEVYQYLVTTLTVANTSQVLVGLYSNNTSSRLIQRAHNFIANQWMLASNNSTQQKIYILGGAFAIHAEIEIKNYPNEIFWGAEDKLLADLLHQQKFQFKLDHFFQVLHFTNPSFIHFMRRAWLHGINDIKLNLGSGSMYRYSSWFSNIDFRDCGLIALVLLHFCIQKGAKLFQQIRQLNKI